MYGDKPADAVAVKPGNFNQGKVKYTAKDIRFTTKGGDLYAVLLAAPAEDIRIVSLGADSKLANKPVASVQMLGGNGDLKWRQDADALLIAKPASLPELAVPVLGFKITFE